MNQQQLQQLHREMMKTRDTIELLREKRELEIELENLSPDEKVGRGFFFRLGIDQDIEQLERKHQQLNREATALEKRIERESQPDRSWRDYASQLQDSLIKRKDRGLDVAANIRERARNSLPQHGKPDRTEADRLKAEMDRVVQEYFPHIHRQQQQDQKAQARDQYNRERPYREAAKEHARRERQAAWEAARAEARTLTEHPAPDSKEERQQQLQERLARLNERLRER